MGGVRRGEPMWGLDGYFRTASQFTRTSYINIHSTPEITSRKARKQDFVRAFENETPTTFEVITCWLLIKNILYRPLVFSNISTLFRIVGITVTQHKLHNHPQIIPN